MPSEEEKQACLQRVPEGRGSNMEHQNSFITVWRPFYRKMLQITHCIFAQHAETIDVSLGDFVNIVVGAAVHQEIDRVVRHFDQLVEILTE